MTLFLQQDGPIEAPAVLLMHGSAASGRSWDRLVPLLSTAHHVIRLDLLGCGRSAKPDGGGYAVPEQARAVGDVLDRLGIGRAVVVGHSSGGGVATALAEERPELVGALALVNTGPSLAAFISPDTGPIPADQWPPSDEQIRALAATGFGPGGFDIPPELVDDVRGMTHHSFTATMLALRAYLAERPLPDRLVDVGKPLLVVFGQEDRRWRSASAADYRVVPGAQVELLPGLGHSPILEDPERTAALLLPFAARNSRIVR